MRDILFPLVLIAFFTLATLLVRACEALVASPETDRLPGESP